MQSDVYRKKWKLIKSKEKSKLHISKDYMRKNTHYIRKIDENSATISFAQKL